MSWAAGRKTAACSATCGSRRTPRIGPFQASPRGGQAGTALASSTSTTRFGFLGESCRGQAANLRCQMRYGRSAHPVPSGTRSVFSPKLRRTQRMRQHRQFRALGRPCGHRGIRPSRWCFRVVCGSWLASGHLQRLRQHRQVILRMTSGALAMASIGGGTLSLRRGKEGGPLWAPCTSCRCMSWRSRQIFGTTTMCGEHEMESIGRSHLQRVPCLDRG
mmetsp:Transcript_40142/g.78695  ORF Transcript_40142/g.78695 Transcript_40142/m.78695 type:complete len:218 (+) Transcript_40142:276-929(+)